MIPQKVSSIKFIWFASAFEILLFEFLKLFKLLNTTRREPDSEIIEEIVYNFWFFCHLILYPEFCMIFVTENTCSFISEYDRFFEKWDVGIASVLTVHKYLFPN